MKIKQVVIRIILATTFLLLLTGFSATSAFGSGENWLTGWANRIKITIDHTKIDANLTDFPVLVHLSSSSGRNKNDISAVFDELTSNTNRKKIAVTTSDGAIQCYVEIGYWSDAEEQAALWVKVPDVSSTTDTVLYLYYDSAHVDNTNYVGDTGSTPAQKVWDSNFVGVWHLTENGNGTTGEYKDSTANAHHGTGGGGVASTAPTRVLDELGLPVQSFAGDGTLQSSYIQIPNPIDQSLSIPIPGGFTVEVSHSPSKEDFGWATHYAPVVHKNDTSGNKEWSIITYDSTGGNNPEILRVDWNNWYNNTPNQTYGAGSFDATRTPINTWANISGVSTCTDSTHGTATVHRDGKPNSSVAIWETGNGGAYVNYVPGPAPVTIGCLDVDNTEMWYPGRIKELRISKVDRSLAWLLANSNSLNDNLLSFEALSNKSPTVATNAVSGLTTTGATLNANLTSKGTASTVTVSFIYGLTTSYGSTVSGIPATMTDTGAFSAELTGLTPNTLYHYRAKAVGDGNGYGSDQTFTTPGANSKPALNAIGNKIVNEGSSLTFSISAIDADDDQLVYSAFGLPDGASFNSGNWTFSWTPRYNQAGVYTVPFEVSDGELTDSEDVTIIVAQLYEDWDVNGDIATNVLDMVLVGQHWSETGLTGWIREDTNEDGAVNVLDMIIIGQHWTEQEM